MTDKTDSKEREDVELSRACVKAWDSSSFTSNPMDAVHPMFSAAFELGYRASIAPSSFDAADMATASAQGFRDGVASLAASAGSEPVARQYQGGDGRWHNFIDARHEKNTIDSGEWPIRALYTHPSPPEGMVGGWMPIETAPRDGKFLVRDGTWHGEVASTPKLSDVAIVERSDGGAFEVSDTDYYTAYITNPTGWMPLPPTTSAGSGKGE